MADGPVEVSLLSRCSDGVLWLTFNRPHARNAINYDLRGRLRVALAGAAASPDVRVVVIQGDDRAFCSGGDVKEMGGGAATTLGKLEEGREIVERIARLPKPVVAAVRGHAAGAGFSLALTCDLIVADTTAVFRSVFISRGLIPDMSGTYWLARQVGLHRAKEIVLTGRPVSAGEAHALGLVSRLWAPAEFEDELGVLVRELAAGPTVAYGASKRLLNGTFETDLSAQLDAEALNQVHAAGSEDHRNSVAAFRAKQPPVFHGR